MNEQATPENGFNLSEFFEKKFRVPTELIRKRKVVED